MFRSIYSSVTNSVPLTLAHDYVYTPLRGRYSDSVAKDATEVKVKAVKEAIDSIHTPDDVNALTHVTDWLTEETREKKKLVDLRQQESLDPTHLREAEKFLRETRARHVNLAREYGRDSAPMKAINDAIRPLVLLFVSRRAKEAKAEEVAHATKGLQELDTYTKVKLHQDGKYTAEGQPNFDTQSIIERRSAFDRLVESFKK